MTRFQVITEKNNGRILYLLRDHHTGARARVLPSLGANCLELALPAGTDGATVASIDDLKYLDKVDKQPSRYGIPVLFPWPSGLPGGEFLFEGKLYRLNAPGEDRPRHHGFVNREEWRVVRSDCDNTGAWLTCAIDSVDCGDIAQRYPSQFTLELTFRLHGKGFSIEMTARNSGESNMPFGIGLHPYFTIPFGKSGSAADCRLAADVSRQWDLDVTVPFKPGTPRPEHAFLATPEVDITSPAGTPLAGRKLNEVFEAKFGSDKTTTATVIDPGNDITLTVTASQDFGTWVFYTPPDRNAISLEPWTLTPNGFNLAASGMAEAGMLTLSPGQVWSGHATIALR